MGQGEEKTKRGRGRNKEIDVVEPGGTGAQTYERPGVERFEKGRVLYEGEGKINVYNIGLGGLGLGFFALEYGGGGDPSNGKGSGGKIARGLAVSLWVTIGKLETVGKGIGALEERAELKVALLGTGKL